jgi:GNAT superfamily N-acetyltransferase
MTDFVIRPPTEKDIEALAKLHFYMWNEFYKDFLPRAYSEKSYTMEQCHAIQLQMLHDIAHEPNNHHALAAFNQITGDLAAISYINRNHDMGNYDLYVAGFDTEFQRLYIGPDYRTLGLGEILLNRMKVWMKENHYTSFYAWAFDLNPYGRFYPKHGATIAKKMLRDYTGTILNLTAYGWRNNDPAST